MTDALIHEEAFNLLCGPKLGEGIHRMVFLCRLDPSLVVKVEHEIAFWTGSNAAEWKNWDETQYYAPCAKWLAPCKWISPNSRVMIQSRTTPCPPNMLPDKIPGWLMDIKHENFGLLDGRLVVHDYPMINTTLSKRLKKADWA